MHALIIGKRGAGKSTLIRSVIARLGMSAYGFETVKEVVGGRHEIHIYPYGQPHIPTEENRVGLCDSLPPTAYPEVFDRFSQSLTIPTGRALLVMDELGFLENDARAFQSAVLRMLDADIPVLAAVKDMPSQFLDAARSHPKCVCFSITPDNRQEMTERAARLLETASEEINRKIR